MKIAYSVEETSKALGIGKTKIYELVKKGSIPSIRLDNRILIPVQALNEFINEKTA